MEGDLERYEEAFAWRHSVLPAMRRGLELLSEACEACPTSTERLYLQRAVRDTRAAIKECERGMTVSRKLVEREKRRT